MKINRKTWTVIILILAVAAFLQLFTYYKYAKLNNAVADFNQSVQVAQTPDDSAAAYAKFYQETGPLLNAQQADAKGFWAGIFKGCYFRNCHDQGRGTGTPYTPTGGTGSGYSGLECQINPASPQCVNDNPPLPDAN